MNGATVFQMVSGLGDAFGGAYSDARKQAQEDEAPTLISNLMNAYKGGGAAAGSAAAGVGSAEPPAASAPLDAPSRSLPTFAQGSDIGRYASAIQSNESGGKYGIVGPTHKKYGRALGAYQVMESNLPSWSKEAIGREVSPDEFLRSPQIQDTIFQTKFGQAVAKYGNPQDAASVWFTGRPLAQGANAKDVLGTTGAEYVRRFNGALGKAPSGSAPSLPATAMRMPSAAGIDPQIAPPQRSSVAVADNEADVQALEREMGMLPSAPRQVASAEPDAANLPAAGAQPVGFVVPPGGAQAAAPSQAFGGFPGGASTRMTPELQTALNAAWRNPNTRAMAGQIFGQLLKGQDSGWDLKDVNGQSAWVNTRNGQILPIGQAKRNTATVGNSLVDTATGDVLFTAPDKDSSKFTYQAMPGVGMVALHSTDPTQSRVIINNQPPRPLTVEERQAYGIPEGTGAGMGPDGKPFGLGGSRTQVNVDTKGAGKFAEKANELQAKRYSEMVEAADNAVPLRADIDTMASLGEQISTGKLAGARLGLAQYAQAAGLDSIANSLTDGKIGEMEAFTALADKLTPRMRVPGSGATSDAEGRAFKNSLPSLLKSPGGNAIIADTFRGLADYQAQAGDIAGKALRGEISQAEADQALKALPSPYARFRDYRGGQRGAADASGARGEAAGTIAPKAAAPTGPASIPMAAVRALRSDPNLRSQFDAKYGAGASARILGPVRENGPDSILAGP